MSRTFRRCAGRIDIRFLLISLAVVAAIGAGLFALNFYQRRAVSDQALEAGQAAAAKGDWNEARVQLGRWLARHPDDAETLMQYADAQLHVQPVTTANVDQAAASLRRLLRLRPKDEAAFDRLALLYEATGNFNELEVIASNRAKTLPGDPRAALYQARAVLFREKYDDAEAALAALLATPPDDTTRDAFVQGCVLMSMVAAQRHDPGAATEWVQKALAVAPQDPATLLQRASLQRQAAAESTAADKVAALLKHAKDDLAAATAGGFDDSRLALGAVSEWLELGDYEQARSTLATVAKTPSDEVLHYFIDPQSFAAASFELEARIQLALGLSDDFIQRTQALLEEIGDRPQRTTVLPSAINVYVAAGRLDLARAALATYENIAALLPSSSVRDEQIALLRAIVADASGQPFAVLKALAPVASRAASRPLIARLLARAYEQTGQRDRAEAALRNVTVSATTPEDARQLARRMIDAQQFDAARKLLAELPDANDVATDTLRAAAEVGAALSGQIDAQTGAALLDELAALVKRDPKAVEPRLLQATVLRALNRTGDAEATLRAAIGETEAPLRARLALSDLLESSQPDAARAVLAESCQASPESDATWLALAAFDLNRDKLDDAAKTLSEGIAAVPSGEARRRLTRVLAQVEQRQGHSDKAIARLEAVLKETPNDATTLATLAAVKSAKDTADEVDKLRNIEGDGGVQWRYFRARLLLAQNPAGSREEAIKLLEFCVDAAPSWDAPLMMLGELYERANDLDAAERVYARGRTSQAADRLLQVLWRAQRFDAARDVLQRLTRGADDAGSAARQLGQALAEGDVDAALAALDKTPDATNGAAYVLRASLRYGRDRDLDGALRDLDQALAAGADPIVVAQARVTILNAAGKPTDAKAALDTLVQTTDLPAAYRLRGAYLLQNEEVEAAATDFAEYAARSTDDQGPAILGEFQARTGKLDDAIATWQQGLTRFPESALLRRGLCQALLIRRAEGDVAAGRKLLDALRAERPGDADLATLAVVELRRASPPPMDEVRSLVEGFAKVARSGTADAFADLATVALDVNDTATAEAIALAGLTRHPGNSDLAALQAQALLIQGKPRDAVQVARDALARTPDAGLLLTVLVDAAKAASDEAALRFAADATERLIADGDARPEVAHARATALAALGDETQALAVLERFVATPDGAKSVPVQLLRFDLALAQGRNDDAQAALAQVRAIEPENPLVRRGEMLLLARSGDRDGLEREGRALLQASGDEGSVDAERYLMIAGLLQSDPTCRDLATQLTARVLVAEPRNATAFGLLAQLRYQSGDARAAAEAYAHLLDLAPDNAEAHNNYAWILCGPLGKPESALASAKRAVELAPRDANYRDTLATVYEALGHVDEAGVELMRAFELASDDPTARARIFARLVTLYPRLSDPGAVRRLLEQAGPAEDFVALLPQDQRDALKRQLQEIRLAQ